MMFWQRGNKPEQHFRAPTTPPNAFLYPLQGYRDAKANTNEAIRATIGKFAVDLFHSAFSKMTIYRGVGIFVQLAAVAN
jgi:hypothetical protein